MTGRGRQRFCQSARRDEVTSAQRLTAVIDLDRALGGGLQLQRPDSESGSDSIPDLAKAPTP